MLGKLSSLYEIWFSGANTQRFNIENRLDDFIAGSTGFVSNVNSRSPSQPEKTCERGVADGTENQQTAPSPAADSGEPLGRMGHRPEILLMSTIQRREVI
jgi:hypothetical protein